MFDYYIYPCNANNYDIVQHFLTRKEIVWRPVANIRIDDIVFIYVGKTQQEIRYKCRVISEKASEEIIQANAYAIPRGKIANKCSYIIMEMIQEYPKGTFPLSELKENGMGQFMVPMKVHGKLKNYLILKDKLNNVR